MKTLYFIGGAMGVGKTTVSRLLRDRLPASVFLDGDWCWDMHPFVVTEETKQMVTDNITYLLNNFLHCSAYQNIIFCWVMHEQAIIDSLLAWLDLSGVRVRNISLIADPASLTCRLQADIAAGRRTPDVIERSLARLPLYERLSTEKIDVSRISAAEAAELILREKE